MTLNQKLFLKINAEAGRHPILDKLMIFSARWLIYAIVIGLGLLVISVSDLREILALIYFGLAGVASTLGLAIHWIVGYFWHHNRPHHDLPNIKVLIPMFQEFKSFPSDHTMIVTCFLTVLCLITVAMTGFSWAFFVHLIVSLLLISLVGFARIYVGAHYPRDIVAGFFSGLFFVGLTIAITMLILFTTSF